MKKASIIREITHYKKITNSLPFTRENEKSSSLAYVDGTRI
jgi:hypothetical protein